MGSSVYDRPYIPFPGVIYDPGLGNVVKMRGGIYDFRAVYHLFLLSDILYTLCYYGVACL